MAKAKTAPAEPRAKAPTSELPVHGEYRCYWPNEWNRPCNKYLGSGAGPFARRCPRCKRPCAFEGAS